MKCLTNKASITLALGLGLALTLLWLLSGSTAPATAAPACQPQQAPGDVITVCLSGGCDYTSVQAAVDATTGGEIIKVAAGNYTGIHYRAGVTQVVYISQSLTIQGGYTTTDWLTSYPLTRPTTLDAEGQGRVIYLTGSGISVTLEGLRLTRGDASGMGGGPAWAEDVGGGVYVTDNAILTLRNSEVYSNAAYTGGGVYVNQSDNATLADNRIYSNTANWGGGVNIYRGESVSLTDNDIYGNLVTHSGGGIYLHLTGYPELTGNDIYSNTADWDGAGIYLGSAYGGTTLTDNRIYSNTAGSGGGGLHGVSSSDVSLIDNKVYGNAASAQGGGIYLSGSRDSVWTGNKVYNNTAGTNGGGIWLRGVTSGFDNALLMDNEIYGNTGAWGGGVYVYSSRNATLRGNVVYSNTSGGNVGGGINLSSSDEATLADNEVYSNTGANGGGINVWFCDDLTMTGNEIHDNAAGTGGGVYLTGGDNVRLTNNIVVENQTTGPGTTAGIVMIDSDAHLAHTTVARNGGVGGDGIYLTDNARLRMTNTVLVSHAVGIRVTAGSTATLEATLWGGGAWANGTDWIDEGTLVTGTYNYWGDPVFVDPDGGDYHIGSGSAAHDKGVRTDVTVDIDDEARPRGDGYDIGADEFPDPLHVIKQANPVPAMCGAQLTYVISVTNFGAVTLTATITDHLPSHVTPGGDLTWPLESIAPGGTWSQPVVVTVVTGYGGPLVNAVEVTTDEGATGANSLAIDAVCHKIYLPLILRNAP